MRLRNDRGGGFTKSSSDAIGSTCWANAWPHIAAASGHATALVLSVVTNLRRSMMIIRSP